MANQGYPPVSFYFKVTFSGGGLKNETSFKEVTGLNVDFEPDEIIEGGLLEFRHRVPKVPKYTNLILKRGLVTDSSLRTWVEKALNEFTFTPVTVTIALLNEDGKPLMSWIVKNAWPVKWDVSNFDSQNNTLVIESLELAFDSFKIKT